MKTMIVRNVFLMLLISATAASAQEASPAVQEAAETPAPVVAAPVASPTVTKSKEQIMDDLLSDGNPLRTRQEEAFDTNGNKRLDPNEIRAMCKKMYEDTAGGPVANTSDIFWAFDTNKDGYIDRSEASALSRYSL